MNRLLFVMCICFSTIVFGQHSAWKRTGTAEKFWVISHPFVAKKAYIISQQVIGAMDSLKLTNYFEGNTASGSRADAVRHAYWMASLTAKIGKRKALKLGKAHEKKNRKDFEKGVLEEQFLPDQTAMSMDLRNNEKGAEISMNFEHQLLEAVLRALRNGDLWWIKQNDTGEFLDANGKIIPLHEWSGKWKNARELILTN